MSKLKVYHLTNGKNEAMVEAFGESMAKGRFTSELNIVPTPSEIFKIRVIGIYEKDSDELKDIILEKGCPLFRETTPELSESIHDFLNTLKRPDENTSSESMFNHLLALKLLDSILDGLIEEDAKKSKCPVEENSKQEEESEKPISYREQLDNLMERQHKICSEIMRLKEERSEIESQIKTILDR